MNSLCTVAACLATHLASIGAIDPILGLAVVVWMLAYPNLEEREDDEG